MQRRPGLAEPQLSNDDVPFLAAWARVCRGTHHGRYFSAIIGLNYFTIDIVTCIEASDLVLRMSALSIPNKAGRCGGSLDVPGYRHHHQADGNRLTGPGGGLALPRREGRGQQAGNKKKKKAPEGARFLPCICGPSLLREGPATDLTWELTAPKRCLTSVDYGRPGVQHLLLCGVR